MILELVLISVFSQSMMLLFFLMSTFCLSIEEVSGLQDGVNVIIGSIYKLEALFILFVVASKYFLEITFTLFSL